MTQIKSGKTYDEQVKDWWAQNFGSLLQPLSLHSFMEVLQKSRIHLNSFRETSSLSVQIFRVIEGDTLLIKNVDNQYCLFYPRHNTFIALTFPFEENYRRSLIVNC